LTGFPEGEAMQTTQTTNFYGEDNSRRMMALLARRLLQFYWLTCVSIIAIGLIDMHPEWRAKIDYALEDPALELTGPFPSCAAAHSAGYFSIPRTSKAYVERQDGDLNGRSCEPYPGYPPDYMGRLRVIENRLMLPTVPR
jgi:hypothetical protein